MSGADLDLVVRARRAVLDGALRPCSVGVRDGQIVPVTASAEGRCLVDAGFWDGAIPGNAAELRPLRRTWLRGRPCPSPAAGDGQGEPAGRLITRTET